MTTKVPQLGGLDYDFVKEPPDSLKCLICMMVVKDPWQHSDCGRVYCKVCLDEFRKVKDICPNCRTKAPVLFKDGRSEKDARGLFIHCNNKYYQETHDEKGEEVDGNEKDGRRGAESCTWTGELGNLEDHHRNCPLQPVPCPNKCTENGEEVLITRKYMQKHLSNQCLNRDHICPHCGATGTYLELTTIHSESCSKIPIACPNKPCVDKVPRDKLKVHISDECLYTILPCAHQVIGCSSRLQRKDMQEHENNLTVHVTAAREKIESLEKEIIKLKENMAKECALRREVENAATREKLNRRGSPVTFKMSNYSSRLSQNKPFKSGSFYTSPTGYKMCVIIEPNATSKGQYLAVYAHFMKGEHDDLLTWPLTGTVTFELLNQLGNHTHKKGIGTFLPNDKENRRVTEEGRGISVAGHGCPKFISCSKLGEGSHDVQYLKNDCLYWRVSTEVPDTLDSHWLRTT